MITHLLLLQPKETTRDEEILTVIDDLDNLFFGFPYPVAFQIARNQSPAHQGYTFAFILRCAESVLQAVLAHPNYGRIHAELQRLCQHIVAFDGNVEVSSHRRKQPRGERTSLKAIIPPEEWAKKSGEERLKILLMDELGVSEQECIPSASFVEDLDADSLDLVEIIFAMQEEFQLEISDEDVEKITTVGEALDYLKAKGVL